MKKMIVMVAVAATAALGNAAGFVWGFGSGEYTDHNGNAYELGTALLYLGTVTASDSAFNIGTAQLIATSGYDSDWFAYGNQNPDSLSVSDLIVDPGAGDVNSQHYTLILLEKSGVTSIAGYEGYYAIVEGDSTRGTIPGATTTYYSDMINYDAVQTSSYMSVPEPTSGLLLLLGMAGLALKRKRA